MTLSPGRYLFGCAAGLAALMAPVLFTGATAQSERTTPSPRATDPSIPRGSSPGVTAPSPAAARQPIPQLTREQQEDFLRSARIVGRKQLTEGTTKSWRLTMSDGRVTHDVHVQTIDIYRPVFRGKEGTVERNFRDSWKYNLGAYHVDKLIGLNMVPATIQREFEGRPGSYTWWVDDVWMDEATRRDKKIKPPAADFWSDQLNKVRVFDQLIANSDRNQGNLLITRDWRLWIIDHTRAFRVTGTLLRPDVLSRCDKTVLERMRKLDRGALKLAAGAWLRPEEIDTLLARRDVIVSFFDNEIREKGEDSVLTGIPRKTPHVSVP